MPTNTDIRQRRKNYIPSLPQKYYQPLLDDHAREEERKKQQRLTIVSNKVAREKKENNLKGKILYGLQQAAFMIITLLCTIGISGLTFFFVHQFGIDYGLNPIAYYTVGSIFAAIVFTGYFFLFTMSEYKRIKKSREEALNKTEEEIAKEKEAENKKKEEQKKQQNKDNANRKTTMQKIFSITNVVIGAIGILFLAGGNYLGIMDVGHAIHNGAGVDVSTAFMPIAIISAIAMFTTMLAYFYPDMRDNAADIVKPKQKSTEKKNEKENEKENEKSKQKTEENKNVKASEETKANPLSIRAQFMRFFYRVVAVGAAIAFASFKLYSTIHLVEVLGFHSPLVVGVTGAIAFVTLLIMTATTSSVRMWKTGELESRKSDKLRELKAIQNEYNVTPEPVPSKPFTFYLGWIISFLMATILAGGAFLGMFSLCGFYPPLSPLFIIVGVFAAISRLCEVMIYYGPAIVENMSGVKHEYDIAKVIKEIDDKIIAIKKEHDPEFKKTIEKEKAEEEPKPEEIPGSEKQLEPVITMRLRKSRYEDPLSITKRLLGRKHLLPKQTTTEIKLRGEHSESARIPAM